MDGRAEYDSINGDHHVILKCVKNLPDFFLEVKMKNWERQVVGT